MLEAAIFGISAAIFWGAGDFISRRPSSQIGYYLTSAYMQILSFVGLTIYLIMTGILFAGNSLPMIATLLSLLSPVPILLARAFYKERVMPTLIFGIGILPSGVSMQVYLQ